MYQRALNRWDPDDYLGTLSKDHGYLNKRLVADEFPHLHNWAAEWTARTRRDMSYAVFGGQGPKDVSESGFLVHFQETDWIVHPRSGDVDPPFLCELESSDRKYGSSIELESLTEQRWSEEFGTEIVSDFGTIVTSEAAKTIVLQSITDRMTASTRRLVESAVAPHVDASAVSRIGDPDYVIALRNSDFPSMGGKLLHCAELDSIGESRSGVGVLNMESPQAERLLREMAVSELIMAWAHDSNGTNIRSLAIQEAAIAEFGLSRVGDWPMSTQLRAEVEDAVLRHGVVHRELLRVQYNQTQQELSQLGVNNLILYRGYAWSEDARPEWSRNAEGARFEMPVQRPLSSWTGSRRIAADWLDDKPVPGTILAARFPREQILAFPRTGIGCLWQVEFVVLAGGGSTTLDTIHHGG